ncbi:hypothetical protein [Actinokineospora globicatena]|uniref:hypothetical protein n=1 Tax=Actinokineospora globicatena TaxID=103729 RepID=UPI0020A2BEF6|nr:hypothetical protein [Actinokineospora globicatena]MCP2306536.1 tRNA synthetase class II core domain (G, H, P, S and T) [Actinokineospora globicatena]GLW81967.1 hypothetical protein Aglo01_64480 [Actinokineospora globicatena]GLW88761.1 hypothetical protein Aglo02_64000 [Actinokineospora globicatena]
MSSGLGAGLPLETGVPGVFLSPPGFERVIGLLRDGIAALAADEPFHRLVIPPVISRATIERAGYVAAFPNLLGTVHGYGGTPSGWARLKPLVESGGEWHAQQQIGDLVLLPAACYPVYATLEGRTLDEPAKVTVEASCFRQEATSEPGRMRSFRMLELVTVATDEHCLKWRAARLEQVEGWFTELGLAVSVEVADDPFFGPGRKVYQAAQRMQELKWELRVPVADGTVQAVASANYHKEHFGETFGITAGGEPANTSCVAFGLERLAMALIARHGEDSTRWPADVLAALGGGRRA